MRQNAAEYARVARGCATRHERMDSPPPHGVARAIIGCRNLRTLLIGTPRLQIHLAVPLVLRAGKPEEVRAGACAGTP